MENKNVSVFGIVLILSIAAISSIACMGVYKVAGANIGHTMVAGALFMVAWVCEMVFPDEAFMKLVLVLSGLGFMGMTMFSAIFPGLPGQILQALMFFLMILSMGQLMLHPVEEAPPD